MRRRGLFAFAGIFGLLAVWEAAFHVVGWRAWIFPAPSHVIETLVHLTSSEAEHILQSAIVTSVVRLAIGFVISLALGSALGVAMWRLQAVDALFGGISVGMQTLPSVCWVPLATLLLGLNEAAVLFVLVMGSVFAVALALRDGLRQLPPTYERAGRMLGARSATLMIHVLLPASMPAVTSALRQGFSFAWRSLMGAELLFLIDRKGVGYLLHQGREFGDVAQVIGAMATMVVLGLGADALVFRPLERRVHMRFGLERAT